MFLYVSSKQSVKEVVGDGFLVDGKHLHGVLHAVEGGGLPDKVHAEVNGAVSGDVGGGL